MTTPTIHGYFFAQDDKDQPLIYIGIAGAPLEFIRVDEMPSDAAAAGLDLSDVSNTTLLGALVDMSEAA